MSGEVERDPGDTPASWTIAHIFSIARLAVIKSKTKSWQEATAACPCAVVFLTSRSLLLDNVRNC